MTQLTIASVAEATEALESIRARIRALDRLAAVIVECLALTDYGITLPELADLIATRKAWADKRAAMRRLVRGLAAWEAADGGTEL